ncbi:MAG: hypothetical protein QW666_04240 [Candidatus Woesearchaeota archaeon]
MAKNKKQSVIKSDDVKKEGIKPEKEEFLESEEHEETPDEFDKELHAGEKEEDVYTEEGREDLVEDDEIEPWEEGFAEGAADKGEYGDCAHCGKPLRQEEEKVIEKEISHKIYQFCSDKCASKGLKKKTEED